MHACRYLDVITRLDPIIHEIERSRDPILVVGHQGILRVIYACVGGMPCRGVKRPVPTYRCPTDPLQGPMRLAAARDEGRAVPVLVWPRWPE